MILPSLHPAPVSAVCERRRRWAFGLTPRTIGLLLAGFVWLVLGYWDWRLAFAMPAWCALVLLAALLDGLRLPAAAKLTVGRSWSNAPALDSEAEIELTLENHGFWDLPYQVCFAALVEPALAYHLTGRNIPQSFFLNAREEGENILSWMTLADGDLLCPQGLDWADRDVVGGKSLGMTTDFARYGDTFDTVASGADYDIDDLLALIGVVDRIHGASPGSAEPTEG